MSYPVEERKWVSTYYTGAANTAQQEQFNSRLDGKEKERIAPPTIQCM